MVYYRAVNLINICKRYFPESGEPCKPNLYHSIFLLGNLEVIGLAHELEDEGIGEAVDTVRSGKEAFKF